MPLTAGRISAWVTIGYLLLTLFQYSQGFLANLDHRIQGTDSIHYYIYLPSLLLDGDVDFSNQISALPNSPGIGPLTERGLAPNPFSMGPALFWSPFFLLGHLATLIANALGGDYPVNGFSPFHMGFVFVGDSLLGLAGLLLTIRFLWGYASPGAILLATLGLLGATPLTHYLWSFTAISHNVSFLASALFLLSWKRRGLHSWTALAGALMVLARWQDGLLLLIPALDALARMRGDFTQKQGMGWLGHNAWFMFIVLLGMLPQSLIWHTLYGSYLLVPQGSGFLDFSNLALWDVLFNTRHGLFLWHPLLLAGLLGWALLWRRAPMFTFALFMVFLTQWIVNAAVEDWWAGWSFGQRRFMGLLPLFALGLALGADHLVRGRRALITLWGGVVLLTVWNLLFNLQFLSGVIPRSRPLTFHEMVTDKLHIYAHWKAQTAVMRAHQGLMEKDLEQTWYWSRYAHAEAPDYRPARAFFIFTAIVHHENAAGMEVLSPWLREEPDSLTARWAMAEFLVREKKFDQALALFAHPGSPQEHTLRQRILGHAPTVLDPAFVEQFLNETDRMLFE